MADRHIDLLSADIEALRPPSARRMLDIRDKREPGLTLRVVSSGAGTRRAWCWRYRDGAGRQRRLVHGHWPAMDYEKAVEAHRAARRTKAAGVDPLTEKADAIRRDAGRMTVAQLVDRLVAERLPKLKGRAEVERLLRKHVVPAIGAQAVADVTEDAIWRVVKAEQTRLAAANLDIVRTNAKRLKDGKPSLKQRTGTQANRLYSALGTLFTFARIERVIAASPMPKMRKGDELPAEKAKQRPLSDDELGRFWRTLDDTGLDAKTKRALRLILLTACRPSEILGLRRRDVDFTGQFVDRRGGGDGVVRCTGWFKLRNTKNDTDFIVPLPPPAQAVLADALADADAAGDALLFPSDADASRPMDVTSLARAVSRNREFFRFDPSAAPVTPHCLRATAATVVEKLGFGSHAARAVLNHADGSVLRRAYSPYDGLPERADALEAVAREVERLAGRAEVATPDNVVAIGGQIRRSRGRGAA